MESPSQNQTSSYARYRLLSALGGKIADALGVVIAIKTLSAADYGVIGTAVGVMAIIGFVNLTPEDILWRDLPRLRDRLNEHLSAYVWFWLVKFVLVAALSAAFCAVYGVTHRSWNVALAAFAITLLLQVLNLSTLAEVPLFASLQQQRGAAFVLGVRVLWLALLIVNFWMRSLAYYIAALATYSLITATLSAWLLHRRLGVSFRFKVADAWHKVRDAALDFTLWVHLVGRARAFLMRGDLAILGGFGISLAMLGQYTIAVNLVGFALILPGVLENVAAVSFAHHPGERGRNLRRFLAIAVALAVLQLAGAWLLGRTALRMLHVADVDTMFGILMILLAGASVFVVQTPVLAYAMCFRRMRRVFARVFLPGCGIYAASVWWATRQWALEGAAVAHASVLAATGVAGMIYVFTSRDIEPTANQYVAEAESTFQE